MTFLVQLYARLWSVGSLSSGVFTPFAASSPTECMTLCVSNATCSSFFFLRQSKQCTLHNRWITIFITHETTEFYVAYPASCNYPDYQFIRSVGMCLRVSSPYYKTRLWTSAKQECESENARLVKIDTGDKLAAISSMLSEDYGDIDVFIGAHDPSHSDNWIWTDGTPLDTSLWTSGEPTPDEFCVLLKVHSNSASGWNNIHCEDSAFPLTTYICEKP